MFPRVTRSVHSLGFGNFLLLHLMMPSHSNQSAPLYCNYCENYSLAREQSPAVLQGRGCGCWWHHTCSWLATDQGKDPLTSVSMTLRFIVTWPSSIRKVSARSISYYRIHPIQALTNSSDLNNYGEGCYFSVSLSKTEWTTYSVYVHISQSYNVVLYSTK